MKCARLHLQERSKVKANAEPLTQIKKPRRYCQKRLINPEHEEDPRWIDIWDRFHCNLDRDQIHGALDYAGVHQETEDIVLTVQTLKFLGDVEQTKRPRISFKYKNISDGNKHRMFVKQVVTENEYSDEDRSSQLTYYYYDDYAKYLYNSDKSRPTSEKSSVFLKGINNNFKQNKSTQVEGPQIDDLKKVVKVVDIPKVKKISKQRPKQEVEEEVKDMSSTIENTKITYQNTGKRKSLTISRAQSPETVQVIRVDVVCNYSSSSILSDYDETKKVEDCLARSTSNENCNVRSNHFANKYLLTNSVKTLDESLSGGSKVTLLCKTFKLSDRLSKQSDKPCVSKNRKHSHSLKDLTNVDSKVKGRK